MAVESFMFPTVLNIKQEKDGMYEMLKRGIFLPGTHLTLRLAFTMNVKYLVFSHL